ncbi:MAG TPA: ammonium transporter, partial [Terriglobia bacterium]|nr:ammonium transporter [Terriglobia bacterium]
GPISPDNSMPLTGLFYGGGTQLLVAQAIGSAITTVSTFAVALVVMLAVNAMGLLRLDAEGERYGMDLTEHGIPAYPEYVVTASAAPAGMAHQNAAFAPEASKLAKAVQR